MFNLLIGYEDDNAIVPGDRLFEYTDEKIRNSLGEDYIHSLTLLPTLSMPEIQDESTGKFARIGTVTKAHQTRWGQAYTFEPNQHLDPIPAEIIQNLADKLEVSPERWGEFSRTHWSIKAVDLFQVLFEQQSRQLRADSGTARSSGVIQFPVESARDPHLVAIMMPFAKEFDVVHETIQQAAFDANLASTRVDDIWENDHVMADVLSILWKAEIVVADLSGRNPNVFYELGLAHALPRKTVLLTQSAADVPFDLQTIRYLEYGVGTIDRQMLRERLSQRLTTLSQMPIL